jgi:ubiquinone/menaquinone biosynthesis C-methylase UbiE
MRVDPAAFDAFATDYDSDFTYTRLGQMLRGRVWEILARTFHPGDHVLELACGTGEDALWLAGHGVRVTATDGSAEMVQTARQKAQQTGLDGLIDAKQISFQDFVNMPHPEALIYGGIFSNFGG